MEREGHSKRRFRVSLWWAGDGRAHIRQKRKQKAERQKKEGERKAGRKEEKGEKGKRRRGGREGKKEQKRSEEGDLPPINACMRAHQFSQTYSEGTATHI